jgi:outer membrane protein W
MKYLLLFTLTLMFLTASMAQEKGKLRFGLSLGPVYPDTELAVKGLTIRAELKYNLSEKLSAGILFGQDIMGKNAILSSVNQGDSSIIFQLNQGALLTADYYFTNKTSSFAPFVGASFGTFNLYNSILDTSDPLIFFLSSINTIIDPDFVPGAILRTGFEYRKFRLAIEYCYLPPTKYLRNSLLDLETTRNDFLSLNIGFYFGGGKWKRKTPATNN